jgi:hypothetical protein
MYLPLILLLCTYFIAVDDVLYTRLGEFSFNHLSQACAGGKHTFKLDIQANFNVCEGHFSIIRKT